MKPVHTPEAAPGIEDLRMENDLLAQENRILHARLAGLTDDAFVDEHAPAERPAPSPEEEQYRQAFYDLRWFIQRLNGSPFGLVLRRWGGFRVLVDRYGGTGT